MADRLHFFLKKSCCFDFEFKKLAVLVIEYCCN